MPPDPPLRVQAGPLDPPLRQQGGPPDPLRGGAGISGSGVTLGEFSCCVSIPLTCERTRGEPETPSLTSTETRQRSPRSVDLKLQRSPHRVQGKGSALLSANIYKDGADTENLTAGMALYPQSPNDKTVM